MNVMLVEPWGEALDLRLLAESDGLLYHGEYTPGEFTTRVDSATDSLPELAELVVESFPGFFTKEWLSKPIEMCVLSCHQHNGIKYQACFRHAP